MRQFLLHDGIRVRSALLDQEDAKTLGYQFRLTVNWERDLL